MRNLLTAILACLAASLATAAALNAQGAEPEVVTVELSNFKFSPMELTFQHGHTYRLHLDDIAGGGHDFSAPEFFAASTIAPESAKAVAGGKVSLHGKDSADIVLTPEKPGTYPLRCSHFLHAGFGMKGTIIVE